MPVICLDLGAYGTRAQLAVGLKVPEPALDLVTLTSTPCKRQGCTLFAAVLNRGYCILCSQTWFPREFDDSGAPAKYRRGYGLYGPQYQRRRDAGHSTTCCCSSPLCEKIGHAHGGMFRFPTAWDQCLEAARVLGLAPDVCHEIAANPRRYKIAVWHFHPNHRYQKGDGSWGLRDLPQYRDAEGKVFTFPPPNASVQGFIDAEIRGNCDTSLPPWVPRLVRLQRRASEAGRLLSPPPKEITPPRVRNSKKGAARTERK